MLNESSIKMKLMWDQKGLERMTPFMESLLTPRIDFLLNLQLICGRSHDGEAVYSVGS